jgi:hypothetical protein
MKTFTAREPERPEPAATPDPRQLALVWIDSDRATILRWRGRVVREDLHSDVAPHVRGTEHVRRDARIQRAGADRQASKAEARRNEHLRRYLAEVADRLRGDDEIAILGPGTVPERLRAVLQRRPARRGLAPAVSVTPSPPLTARQLAAALRERLGMARRRRTAGVYRWSGDLPRAPSGVIKRPRRVASSQGRPVDVDVDALDRRP